MNCKKYTFCLEDLFKHLATDLNFINHEIIKTKYGYIEMEIDDDKKYFDFKNEMGTPCMDGETCDLLEENNDYVALQEETEGIPFKLSKNEFKIAVTPMYIKNESEMKVNKSFM